MPATARTPNRLISEKSPYLLQHAHNPVDWYPWGDEAFAKAKTEDKPVFLSIGYSTCHWCHVMERESFADEEVAGILNRYFVAVKVDREERPDIDQIYMSVCQAMTGQGGWPLTVIMTPEGKPFFAGTYFPKRSRWGRPGLMDILTQIAEKWLTERHLLLTGASRVAEAFAARMGRSQDSGAPVDRSLLDAAFRQLRDDFDPRYSGFGPAPKFPSPHNLMFLFRYWKTTGSREALDMAAKTLTAMHRGGIYDHLGFGFARYSTDEKWLIPHFEKMLYDNALLLIAYTEGCKAAGDPAFARVAGEIATYVLRDMTGPDGGFYSAEDADSEGGEGKFYVWSKNEIISVLGPERGEVFARVYGVTAAGNFEGGRSVLSLIGQDVAEHAASLGLAPAALEEQLKEDRERLLAVRNARPRPFKDDKVLTAWNALMAAALARAGRVLRRPQWVAAAEKALAFIDTRLRRRDGRLLARYRDGEAAYPAYLDDYAFLLWASLEAYQATFSLAHIRRALDLAAAMEELFWDGAAGGFFFAGADGEALFARPKELYDGAMPSGNSVAAYALLLLARLTGRPEPARLAETAIKVFAPEAWRYPRAYTFFLMAVDEYLKPPRQAVVAGYRGDAATEELLEVVNAAFLPGWAVSFNDLEQPGEISELLPETAEKIPRDGQAAAFICEGFACRGAVSDPRELARRLGQ